MTIEHDKTHIQPHGDDLQPIWWQGRQWAVTEFGIEHRDGLYLIEADRLTKVRPGSDGLPDLVLHLAEKKKTCSDLANFHTALCVALVLHGHGDAFTPDQLTAAFDKALVERKRTDTWYAVRDELFPEGEITRFQILTRGDLERIDAEIDERTADAQIS